MFNCPYCDPNFPIYRVPAVSSYFRVFHASPNSPVVDVYLDNDLVVRRLSYENFSPYLKVMPGKHNVKIYPTGKKDNPVIDTSVDIPDRTIITAAVIGLLPQISLLPIVEPILRKIPGKAYIRFSHLSPNAPNVDVTLPIGRKLFTNVGYKQTTDYISVNPGIYTLNVNLTSNGERVLHVPNMRFLPNRIYTIYAVGLVGKTPPLRVVIPLDGNTYLKV